MLDRREFVVRGLKGVGGLTVLGALGGIQSPGAWAAGASEEAAALTAATLQLGWIANVENMGEFVADDRGYYKQQGLSVKLVPGGPGVSVEPLLVAGKALMALSAPDLVAQARLKGAKVKIVATTFQKNPSAVMSLASKPIKTPHDLVGKKLGLQPSGEVIYNAFFTANGIDPKSITYVPVQFDPSPLVDGEVDAFASFQTNQPIQLALQGVKTYTFLLADFGYSLFTDCCVVTEKTLADKNARATAVKLLRGTIKGWQTALAIPALGAHLVVTKYGKTLGLQEDAQLLTAKAEVPLAQSKDTKLHGLFWMSDAMMRANIQTLARGGINMKAQDLFTTALLREAYQGKRRIA
jgi:ABC-type nitrate/sulfonate/bicarbonate transport system substrate-binding protein